MRSPSVEESLDGVQGPIEVVLVDRLVTTIVKVPFSHPLADGVLPMGEVPLVCPLSSVGNSRVVVSILRVLDGVNIEENLDSVGLTSVEGPLDVLISTISATNVWSVLFESPVTDWETDDLDLSVSKIFDKIFGDPFFPMLSEDGITLLWSKGLTESVLVHTNSLRMGISEESVEHGWGDPWLKDLPSSEVGSNEGSLGKTSSSNSGSGEGSHLKIVLKIRIIINDT